MSTLTNRSPKTKDIKVAHRGPSIRLQSQPNEIYPLNSTRKQVV